MLGSTATCLDTDTKLKRIAWLSANDPHKRFDSLMHHFNEASLAACFHELDGSKAVGIDEVTKAQYGEHLDANLRDLVARMKRMAYRPPPIRQALIPKEGPAGATRPLGISVLEDKIVQKMMQKVLESIYEPQFLNCSSGFRPGRGCHDAIKALHQHLFHHDVETVIDVDLANFFGTIDQQLLVAMLREKIDDERLIRYLVRMFKAGVLVDGELTVSDEGVVGAFVAPCSPMCLPIRSSTRGSNTRSSSTAKAGWSYTGTRMTRSSRVNTRRMRFASRKRWVSAWPSIISSSTSRKRGW